jgi:uncharacterized membrane protein YfcA
MHIFAQFDLLHAIAGMLVGFLVGMTGVGGGSLMTPLLVLMFGIAAQTAVGTDLLYAATTKMAGTAVHGWRSTVDWKIVRRLAAGSLPAACATLVILSSFGRIGKSTEHVILGVLGGMLVLTAIAVFFQRRLIAIALAREPMGQRSAGLSTILLGAVIGLLVSISSVGAGAIGVTALLMLYPRLPISRIVGTDIAHAVPLALVSGFGHWLMGDVNLVLLGNLLIGSIPGVIVGSLVSTRAPDRLLRPALALVMLASGIKLLS